jgi:hypothetical protein
MHVVSSVYDPLKCMEETFETSVSVIEIVAGFVEIADVLAS